MKHAYLIIAHNEFDILKKTIRMIDDERNDIYIHIDRKAGKFDFETFLKIPQKSSLFFTDRIDVHWGAYSLVECEYILFKAAALKHYDYYHLLSGVDIPLVSQDIIHDFFEKHQGKEFVAFDHHDKLDDVYIDRVRYYHFLLPWRCSTSRILRFIYWRIRNVSIKIQETLGVDCRKNANLDFRHASQWFSATDAFIGYILKNEKLVRRLLRYSFCADELFIPTLLYNSEYYKNVYSTKSYEGSMRYMDWQRGLPYTFREEDYDLLIHSGCFWARKVSEEKSGALVDKIFKLLNTKET